MRHVKVRAFDELLELPAIMNLLLRKRERCVISNVNLRKKLTFNLEGRFWRKTFILGLHLSLGCVEVCRFHPLVDFQVRHVLEEFVPVLHALVVGNEGGTKV